MDSRLRGNDEDRKRNGDVVTGGDNEEKGVNDGYGD
jgi:hypothetical protein